MKYIKYLLAISQIFIFMFFCNTPMEEDFYEQIDNLVLINSDGSNKKIIINQFYGSEDKYFVNNDSQILIKRYDDFLLINIDGSIVKTISIDMEMRSSCISFDRLKVAFIGTFDSYQEIFMMDYDGSNLRAITSTPHLQKRFPNFSHDGGNIVYSTVSENEPSVKMIDITSGLVTTLIQDTVSGQKSQIPYWYPIFSNDNSMVFFIYEYWNNELSVFQTALCSIDTTGNNFRIVENDVSRLGNIKTTISTDNLFYVVGSNPHHLFSSDYNGLNKIDLGETPTSTLIDISLNDKKIVFGSTYSNLNNEIFILNLNGSDRKVLSIGGLPVLSADGNKVLFVKMEYLEN